MKTDSELRDHKQMVAEYEAYRLRMDEKFTYNADNNCLYINAVYPYEVDLDEIKDFKQLTEWVHHLCEKTWMDSDMVREFIERVCAIKTWNLYK